MAGWLTVIRSIGGYAAGWAVIVLTAWLGLSELWRCVTTGELLVSFRGGDRLTRWQLITYDSHPFEFVTHLSISLLMAVVGLAFCAGQCLAIRKWWRIDPKSANEPASRRK